MSEDKIKSFGKIYPINRKEVQSIFENEVVITEKVDGSQFSFGVIDNELVCRSKGKILDINKPQDLFKNAVNSVVRLHEKGLLIKGYTYHGECFKGECHNKIAYGRIPNKHIVLYAVRGIGGHIVCELVRDIEARRLGFENTNILYKGMLDRSDVHGFLEKLIDRESYLGGLMEGCVISDGNVYAKFVCEEFKEVIKAKKTAPTFRDRFDIFKFQFKSQARWDKAIQKLKESDSISYTDKDIGLIIKNIINDIKEEEQEYIKDWLFDQFFKEISKAAVSGFPEYYKYRIAKPESLSDYAGKLKIALDEIIKKVYK